MTPNWQSLGRKSMDNKFYHVLNHSLCSFFPLGWHIWKQTQTGLFPGVMHFSSPNMSPIAVHTIAQCLGLGYRIHIPIQNNWIVGNTKDYAKYVDIHAAISKCCELVWQGISVKDAVPVVSFKQGNLVDLLAGLRLQAQILHTYSL